MAKEPNKAPKRNKMQIQRDRARIAELALQGYTQNEIVEKLSEETGITLSRTTIRNDLDVVKKKYLEERKQDMAALLNMEVDRLEALEREAWRAWRASCKESERETIEWARDALSESDDELVIQKVTSVVEKGGVGDPRFFDKIIQIQQERRKLFGLYAPARLGIDVRKREEIIIKGYAIRDASPDAWPEPAPGVVIDGEYELTDNGKLTDGT